jgi:pimeloyl-ACP methyl ester carboxylesterase
MHSFALPSSLLRKASSASIVVLLAAAGCSSESSTVNTAGTKPTTPQPSTPTSATSPSTTTAPSSTKPAAPETTEPVEVAQTGATPESAEALLKRPITTVSQPCPEGFPEKLECGLATVPLDWTDPDAASITKWFGLMRATEPSKGVVIPFYGGPGGSVASAIEQFTPLANAFPDRDVLLTDMRGTGLSSRLGCDQFDAPDVDLPYGGPEFESAIVGCLEALGPDLAYYSTVSAVLDVEALRRSLDLGTLTLYGVSYGTQAANVYGALFPNDLSSVILDGAYDTSNDRLSFKQIDGVRLAITNSCEVSGCDPQAVLDAFASVAATLRDEPKAVDGSDPITEAAFASATIGSIQEEPELYISAVVQAAAGDWQQLLVFLGESRFVPDTTPIQNSAALSFTVDCTDGPFVYDLKSTTAERDAAIESVLASTPESKFLPFSAEGWLGSSWVSSANCDDVAAFDVPDALVKPVDPLYPDVPVLLVHGTRDLQTPLASAKVVAEKYPNSVLVEVAGGTHDLLSQVPCVFELVVKFATSPTLPPADSCPGVSEG